MTDADKPHWIDRGEPKCSACGIAWKDHIGCEGLCRRVNKLEAELTRAAEALQSVLTIGEVKALGLLEVADGCRRVADEIERLRSENDQLRRREGAVTDDF